MYEPIIDGLIYLLRENLEAELEEIKADYADNVPLPMPTQIYYGERPFAPDAAVTIEIDAQASELDGGEYGNTWAIYRHLINIDVWVTSDTADNIARQLGRYAKAVWRVLYKNQTVIAQSGEAEGISLMPMRGAGSPIVQDSGFTRKAWRWSCVIRREDDIN